MVILLSALLAGLLIFICLLLIVSPGRPEQFRDDSGNQLPESISEKTFVTIGGVKQGMFIRGKNTDNPVLLYLHGGPAFPNYFLVDKYDPRLEDYFTVCYWEQRGGGLSYTPDVTLESMTLEQLAADAVEVTNYLRNRFGREKIYLIAHSGGTTLGLTTVAGNPELYEAYIAMAQITSQAESEKIAYKYMLEQFRADDNHKAEAELLKYPVLESDSAIVPFFRSVARDKYMHELGIGTMHRMNSIIRDIFLPVWSCRAYTLREKVAI